MRLSVASKLALSGLAVSLMVGCPKKDPSDPTNPGNPNPNPTPCPNPAAIQAQMTQEKFITVANPIPGEFVVVLAEPKPGLQPKAASVVAQGLVSQYGGSVFSVYESALRGFAVGKLTDEQARKMSESPEVAYVQQNQVMTIFQSQADATWGLDRMDQRDLPLNKTYQYGAQGKGVHAYIIDTGIRVSHADFNGRADLAFDSINDGQKGNDCNGHGTHVAATVGGSTWGVAKNVQLHGVRVLSCQGSGSTAGVIAGVDWVTANRQLPAVANMSLGGGADRAMDDAVRRSIASGVTYVLAGGNSNANACNHSPARTAEAITVGATTNADARASFSNFGECTDIFAPGHQITSAWIDSDSATKTISGTSMAAPHVAGLAALYLEKNPNASPNDVAKALLDNSTPDKVTNAGRCSPNKLGFTGFIAGSTPAAAR